MKNERNTKPQCVKKYFNITSLIKVDCDRQNEDR